MLSVKILRDLWRLRLAVAAIALLAIAAAWQFGFQGFPPTSKTYEVSVATARILVDTPESQVVEVAPEGSEMLGSKANVLANLMVDGAVKSAIARRAGVRPDHLYAGVMTTDGLQVKVPERPDVRVLTTSVATTSDQSQLPIIKVETQAPTTAQALALADAAGAGLGDYLDRKAADDRVAATRRLRVSVLGSAQASQSRRGPGALTAIAAGIFAFTAGCVVLLGAYALSRGWRTAAAIEHGYEPPTDFADLIDDDWLAPSASGAATNGSAHHARA